MIAYRVEVADGPLAPTELRAAVEHAARLWSATGCASLRAAGADEAPALVFSWRRGEHDDCPPFGADPSVAHAGPVGAPSFVHFDADREWSLAGERGLSLRQAALHELGHVLGLDHTTDEAAAMHPEPAPSRDALAPSDLAGIHSLYGGGSRARGDIQVTDESGTLLLALRSIAPPGLCEWGVFDTDGDGDRELLTWRIDAEGGGAFWSYHFGPGPVLERAYGPAWGVAAPGAVVGVLESAHERLLMVLPPGGEPWIRAFDERGLPCGDTFAYEPPPGTKPSAPPAVGSLARGRASVRIDLDGDGLDETVTRVE